MKTRSKYFKTMLAILVIICTMPFAWAQEAVGVAVVSPHNNANFLSMKDELYLSSTASSEKTLPLSHLLIGGDGKFVAIYQDDGKKFALKSISSTVFATPDTKDDSEQKLIQSAVAEIKANKTSIIPGSISHAASYKDQSGMILFGLDAANDIVILKSDENTQVQSFIGKTDNEMTKTINKLLR